MATEIDKSQLLSEMRADMASEHPEDSDGQAGSAGVLTPIKSASKSAMSKKFTNLSLRTSFSQRSQAYAGDDEDTNYFHLLREKDDEAAARGSVGFGRARAGDQFFIPSLVDLSCQTIADNFGEDTNLQELPRDLVKRIVEFLPTTLPLELSVPMIHEDSYWERCLKQRWTTGEQGLAAQSVMKKQVFLEKHVSEFLERDAPVKADLVVGPLLKLLKVCSPYIYSLTISQLRSHLDLRVLFENLAHLKHLTLTYGVLNAGLDFGMELCGMHNTDCISLAKCLQSTRHLTVLRLRENQIDDDKVRAIVAGLVKNRTLVELDLSHNRISDAGASAIAKVLQAPHSKITTVDLSDNRLREQSAEAFRQCLKAGSCRLQSLNLRLNRLGDIGGQLIANGIQSNYRLHTFNLSCNGLGVDSAKSLRDALMGKMNIMNVDLSGNRSIGFQGGKYLLEGVLNCSGLRVFDARLCNISESDIELMDDSIKTRISRT